MENKYIFIIWNRGLIFKEDIVRDLQEEYQVDKSFYIEWSKDKIKQNLLSLYGTKIDNLFEKIFSIGKGKFLLLVIKSKKNHSEEEIEKDLIDRKYKYRNWTANNFRVHCSTNKAETEHDLVVLLGPEYENSLKRIENNSIIKKDVYKASDSSLPELKEALNLFGCKNIKINKNIISLDIDRDQKNIKYFLNIKEDSVLLNNTEYQLKINDTKKIRVINKPKNSIRFIKNEIKYLLLIIKRELNK